MAAVYARAVKNCATRAREPSIGYKRHNEALAWIGDTLIRCARAHKNLKEKESLLDHTINELVYDLYNINAQERSIIS